MPDIRPIETEYNGYRFRSRIEARWAVFFDALGISYQYEPEGFELPDGSRYLPDFYLPQVQFRFGPIIGVWFEVKGKATEADTSKIEAFARAIKQPVVVAEGSFDEYGAQLSHYLLRPNDPEMWWDAGLIFMKCRKCWKYRVQFYESSYQACDVCGTQSEFILEDHPAFVAARSARFEFGK